MEKLEDLSHKELVLQLEDVEHRISQIESQIDAKASRFEAYPDFSEQEQQLRALEEEREKLQDILRNENDIRVKN